MAFDPATINELLKQYIPTEDITKATTLPATWYTSPDMLEFEKEKIFFKTWQPVARTEDLLRKKDYFTCNFLGEPLVITHGLDDNLRAFYNVCRHRAFNVAVGQGNRSTLQCGYHGAVYDLTGKMTKMPEQDMGGLSSEQTCLTEVRVERFGPFVFVNLDQNAESLLEYLGDIPQDIKKMGFDIDTMKKLERREYIVEANWKIVIDNYVEGYHIPIAHPALNSELDYEKYQVVPHRYYSEQIAPVLPDDKIKRNIVDRRIARTSEESKALYYWVFPTSIFNVYPDNLSINIAVPEGVGRTRLIFEWYFNSPGSGEGWESVQKMIQFGEQIQNEDTTLCEAVQVAMNSRSYNSGFLNHKRENGVHHFQKLVHEFLIKP